MHIDGDGLHDGECLYRMAGDPEYCPCEMFRPTPPSSEKPSPASPVKPCPDVPFGSLGNDVEETLDALLGFGRSARMVERAQLRNEIAGLLARRTPAPSPAYTEPTAKECLAVYAEALTKADVPGSIPSERHRAGIEAVLAFCLNRAPDAEYLKSYAEAVLKANTAPSPATGETGSSIETCILFLEVNGKNQLTIEARAELAALRAEVERLRGASSSPITFEEFTARDGSGQTIRSEWEVRE